MAEALEEGAAAGVEKDMEKGALKSAEKGATKGMMDYAKDFGGFLGRNKKMIAGLGAAAGVTYLEINSHKYNSCISDCTSTKADNKFTPPCATRYAFSDQGATKTQNCCKAACKKKAGGPTFASAGKAIGQTVGGAAGMVGTAAGTAAGAGLKGATTGLVAGITGGGGGGIPGFLIILLIGVAAFFLFRGKLGLRAETSLLVDRLGGKYEADVGSLRAERIMHDQGLVL